MRNWINLLTEYADPDDRKTKTFYQGQAHYAPKSLWDREGFTEWFSGSKVAAPNGDPLVAFHGTYEDFSEFKLSSKNRHSYGFNRLGFWFDIDPRTPEYFAGYGDKDLMSRDYPKTTGSVMPCVLSIKNPFHMDSDFIYMEDINELRVIEKEYMKMADQNSSVSRDPQGNARLPDGSVFDEMLFRKISKEYDRVRARIHSWDSMHSERIDGWTQLMKLLPNGVKSSDADVDAFRNELIANGHDGIYIGDTAADFATRDFAGTDWWIAFHPNQIKSIFAQSFTDSPDITK